MSTANKQTLARMDTRFTETTAHQWRSCWECLELAAPAGWHEQLIACYQEPQRHYHTLQHLAECLASLTQAGASSVSTAHVGLAIWFHDAVYEPRALDNEERSAALAVDCLKAAGADPMLCRTVADLVLATKRHVPATADQALLIDIDLSILGQPADRYAEYERQIQSEYSWVSPEIFSLKRKEVLQRFLERPRIYITDRFYSLFEATARQNLSRSIHQLAFGEHT